MRPQTIIAPDPDARFHALSRPACGLFAGLLLAALAVLLAAPAAHAQVRVERLYNGVNRPIPVEITIPNAAGDAELRLLEPESARVLARAGVSSGRADLAALFPQLWAAGSGRESPKLLYAQLFVADAPVGPALVLQPLNSPPIASNSPQGIRWQPSGNTYSGLRIYTDQHVVLETTAGEIEFRLRPDHAPNTAWNFRHLVEGGFYTDIIFHRIIGDRPGRAPFVIQVGDPTGTGTGGPGYMIDLEPSRLPHDFGVLSMARTNEPNTNGSQVFVGLSREGTSFLDGNYTTFAEAVAGAQAILEISNVRVDQGDRPLGDPPRIVRAFLKDAAPYSARPARVQRPAAESIRRD